MRAGFIPSVWRRYGHEAVSYTHLDVYKRQVGYSVDAWEEVAAGKKSSDGRFSGPCYIAKKWTPFEISIVSVPADPTVGVGRSMEDGLGMTAWEAMIQINENQMRGGLMK